MSKSYGNTIEIFAEGKALKKAVMGIVTDSTPVEAPKDPATVQRLRALHACSRRRRRRRPSPARYRAGGMGYGEAKKCCWRRSIAYFADYRRRRAELAATPDAVEGVLRETAPSAPAPSPGRPSRRPAGPAAIA